jgi:cytidylate kinase
MQTGPLVITIDGPAGSGKSTVARRVAQALGLPYLDTGAMYRALTWAALQRGVDPGDGANLVTLFDQATLEITPEGRVLWDGHEITAAIRSSAVARAVSAVAAHPEVRAAMVEAQRAGARRGGLVAEGRDQGTMVFPDAAVKIYLDADLSERARRRAGDLAAAGEAVDLEALQAEISRRDDRDRNRDVGPLSAPTDAVHIDSTSLDVEAVVRAVLQVVARVRERVNPS